VENNNCDGVRRNNLLLPRNGGTNGKALQLVILGFAGLVIFISGIRVLLAHVQGTLL
jgi:hypothetical protein